MKTLEAFIATQRNMSSEEYRNLVGMGDEWFCHFYSVYGNDEVGFYHIGHDNTGGFHVGFDNTSVSHDEIGILEQILWDGYAKHNMDVDETDIIEDLHERARELIAEVNTSISLDEIPLSKFNKTQLRQRNYIMELFESKFKTKILTSNETPEGFGGRASVVVSEGWTLVRGLIGNQMDFSLFSDDNGQVVQMYTTKREAEIELADHIIECATAFKKGDMEDIDLDCSVAFVWEFEDGHYEASDEEGTVIHSFTPEKALPTKDYDIEICRTSYAHAIFTCNATSREEAIEIAIEKAGNHEFSNGSAGYEAI